MTITFDEIRRRYDAEQRADAVPVTAEQLPLTYEAITPAWLTNVLARETPGAALTGMELGPRDEGTSSRRRIVLAWNETGHAAGLPSSVFCKGTQSLASRYMLGMNEGVQAEVNFYTRVRPLLDIRAPEALFARFDPTTLNSLIVMRDLRAEIDFCQIDTALTFAQVKSQLELLATVHGRFYASPELDTTLAPFSRWETFFTITVDDAGFAEACLRGFTQARSVIPPRLFAREAEVWPATLRCVARHAELPRTFTHNDVHLKNWFICRDGTMGLNDWQNCCKGNWSRDFAYCVSTATVPENRRAWERDLLAFYLAELAARGGPRLAFDDAWRLYRQQLFAALAWWTGTLGQPPEAPLMQPPDTSLEFIRRMAVAIDDLDALDSF
ncbi:MAG: phosphotransferase family protein [Gammaproteobacteria bacterium]